MPEISLNAYENEIDQLVEQARYLEALAHIRHVLGQYPHYMGAYYLLGKLMLEVDLPELAIDMFRRALSADPEHMMARIGLALAHERANDLDAAIWNLERAFELDPSNTDISDELRRMYGRRDGVEPEYITQTRAGLARLYIRGDRPGRAVIELRKLIADSPARPDLMTALTEAYWRDGQLVQAAETCQEILDMMPHNCKANLLLGSLWVNSGQDEGWAYLNRAQDVDLSNAMVTTLFGADALLESRDVTLDRLVYDPDTIEVDQGSTWFKRLASASVSVGISEAPPEMTESELRLVDITAGLESQIEIPDWLRELGTEAEDEDEGGLGWMAGVGMIEVDEDEESGAYEEAVDQFDVQQASGAFETDVAFDEVSDDATAADEELPDWLQELTTQEMAFDLDESEQAPDWLMELVGEEPDLEVGDEAPESLSEGADLVSEPPEAADWLTELATEDETVDAGVEAAPDRSDIEGSDQVAEIREAGVEAAFDEDDWLSSLTAPDEAREDDETAPTVLADEEIEGAPDWLRELQATVVEGEDAAPADGTLAEAELPDWLSELDAVAEPGAEAIAELTEAVVDTEDEEAPDWLRELERAEEVDLQPSDVDAVEEDRLAEMPFDEGVGTLEADTTAPRVDEDAGEDDSWLRELFAEEATAPAEDAPSTEADQEAVAIEEGPADAAYDEGDLEGALTGEAALAWLDSLTVGTDADLDLLASEIETMDREAAVELEGEVEGEDEAEAGDRVITVADAVVEPADRDVGWAELEVEAEPEPVPAPEGAGTDDLMSGDDALAWLESLAAGKEDELRAQAELESEARVAEILGRRPKPPAPPDVAAPTQAVAPATSVDSQGEPDEYVPTEDIPVSAPLDTMVDETVIAAPVETEEDAGLSDDDALFWLESLAEGKEDELRAEAEAESEERVAEILGRKPQAGEPEPETPRSESAEAGPEASDTAEPEIEDEVSVPHLEEEQLVAPTLVEAPELLDEGGPVAEEVEADEGALLSGDDALAWLQSLTVGKEDELRAQAEAASQERVAEILGRKRAAPVEVEPVEEAAVEVAQSEASVEDGEDAQADGSEVRAEALEADTEPAPPEPGGGPGEVPEGIDATLVDVERRADVVDDAVTVPDDGALADAAYADAPQVESAEGEDALAWLESLDPEAQAGLEAQLEADVEAEAGAESDTEMAKGAAYFGWSAFGETPQEVTVADAVPWAAKSFADTEEMPDIASEEMGLPDVATPAPSEGAGVEDRPALDEGTTTPVSLPEPELGEGLPQAKEEAQAPAAVQDEEDAAPPPAVDLEEDAAVPVVDLDEAVAAPPATTASRPEAEVSETTADELDEMRAYVKKKRSDHAARLNLARALWEAGEVQESMEHYGRLIKSSAKTEDVVADLEAYADSDLVQSGVMRTLGDAYMKFGDLDKALDIYNRAMDML